MLINGMPTGNYTLRDTANAVGNLIYRHGQFVHSVEVFGSVARGESRYNSDIDLIICTEDGLVDDWRLMLGEIFDDIDDHYSMSARSRRECAFELFRLNGFSSLRNELRMWFQQLDVFVFPANWRERLEEIQRVGRHSDPMFMANIANDAVAYQAPQGFLFRD